jgi:hypothetical protein
MPVMSEREAIEKGHQAGPESQSKESEGEGLLKAAAPELAALSSPVPPLETDEIVLEPTSLEEMKREWDLKNKSREGISGKLGQLMLTGWTMLG